MFREMRGKRVLLTGASSGIGREIARQLGAKGSHLALVARDEKALKEVAREIEASGGKAFVIPGDLADAKTPQRVLDEAVKALGGLDALINDAGIGTWNHFVDGNEENLRKVFEVNFFAASELMRLAVKPLIRGNQPVIMNVNSMTGRRAMPGWTEYSSSKHALVGLTEALRAEYHRFGIDVLMVLPGLTSSSFFSKVLQKQGKAKIDFEKGLKPEETAQAVVRALEKNTRETWVGSEAKKMLWMHRLFPRMVDSRVSREVTRLWSKG